MTLSETTSFNDQEHAQELFDSLIEDGHDSDEMKEFIEEHGHKDFYLYYDRSNFFQPFRHQTDLQRVGRLDNLERCSLDQQRRVP